MSKVNPNKNVECVGSQSFHLHRIFEFHSYNLELQSDKAHQKLQIQNAVDLPWPHSHGVYQLRHSLFLRRFHLLP